MKKALVALALAGVVSFAGVSPARAQSAAEAAIVKVPFQFIAGEKLLPAGTYRVAKQDGDPSVLLISSVEGKAVAAFAATIGGDLVSAADGSKVNVSFKSFGGHYFLAQVALPGEAARTVRMSRSSAEQILAKLNLAGVEQASPAK